MYNFRINLTLIKLSLPDPRRREKINLSFYLHHFLWCLKPFETPQGSVKRKKCKFIFILIELCQIHQARRVNNTCTFDTEYSLQLQGTARALLLHQAISKHTPEVNGLVSL